ncbi:D-2-hydroxyacid dehydrogenase [Bacillus tuaregi]|uniref:D-2-hydroxyacid dehydrogenase n=1 Tax=Bacillus tuaregi TaxID=1816695 RepID=UPI0008F9133D|nr:D-2-hydroxyacid dehydrogenase [Bacillus tuaregi]
MAKRKMVVTKELAPDLLEQIKSCVPDWEIIVSKDKEVWRPHVNEAEVTLGYKLELDDFSNLKWVQSTSAGINHFPTKQFEANGILLNSANGVHAYPISETIFAYMLGLTRKIHTYVKNQQKKIWHHSDMKLEIHEKTIGIIGVGAIGKETAKIAKAFGMTVLGLRHSGKPVENVDEMYTPDQLNQLLPRCDYVVVTLPLTNETYQMFTARQFQLMKPTAFFINIGRGQLIKEDDLIDALQKGEIAGAGLDVFDKEPLGEDNPLWTMDNVIVTPHTAGSTEYYDKRIVEDIFIPNLKAYLKGQKPSINLVDYSKGY